MKFSSNAIALISAVQEICPANNTSPCCAALYNSALSDKLFFPGSPPYLDSVHSHFAINAQLYPSCIVQPQSAQDVSLAVSTLVNANDGSAQCKFAVRGGGSAMFKGAGSIQGGVTIDLTKMNEIVYHAQNSTVSIMGGAQWGSVYKALKPYGVAVAGGRADTVGVGGLVLGGGLSYFAAKKGLVCDNVEDFEVVLANGEIINANTHSHPDLFRALRGGSNNFGIITKVNLRAFEQGDLWGGIITHDMSTLPQQISALVNFTDHIVDDPNASLVSIWQYSSLLGATVAATGPQYLKPVEDPSPFAEFLKIPSTSSSVRFADTYDLIMEMAPPSGKRSTIQTLTFANEPRVLYKLLEIQDQLVAKIKPHMASRDWNVISFLQPLPTLFGELSKRNGGNVLPLDKLEKNHLIFMLFISWDEAVDDGIIQNTANEFISRVKAYTKSIDADHDYIYLNYADGTVQNPLRSYGEDNFQEILRVAKKYDPMGVFQRQVPGGFKVAAA